jgi:endonuclease/exonuclease/phosphatase family metal-dependent hydrolase
MRKLTGIALLVVAAGFFILKNFDIEGLEQLKLRPKGSPDAPAGVNDGPPPVTRTENTIRIGSFNIQVFGSHKLAKPGVMNLLADVARRFDILAIQEVRATTNDILPRFVDLVNSTGRHYDFIIGPRLGRTSSKEQYAYIFDTASIETDRSSAYTVEDPDDQLHREPFVGWFRVRGPRNNEAFTFTLVNVHTDPDDVSREVNALANAYRAIRDDGRQEDDTILLGDLNASDRKLGQLGAMSGMTPVISGTPTNTRGDRQYDNILFTMPATQEFTGRGGVFDLIREYNLTVAEALEVSDHLPIWAEFSIYEGGQPGRFAGRSNETR